LIADQPPERRGSKAGRNASTIFLIVSGALFWLARRVVRELED
jgi:hypothetical protein